LLSAQAQYAALLLKLLDAQDRQCFVLGLRCCPREDDDGHLRFHLELQAGAGHDYPSHLWWFAFFGNGSVAPLGIDAVHSRAGRQGSDDGLLRRYDEPNISHRLGAADLTGRDSFPRHLLHLRSKDKPRAGDNTVELLRANPAREGYPGHHYQKGSN